MFEAKATYKANLQGGMALANVPSKLRGCAAAQLVRKRRAAVSICRAQPVAIIKLISFIY